MAKMERAAGVLLAVSSLEGPYGIGAFGVEARRWIEFLAAAGQKFWQILPLGPTGWGDSPYQSPSAFAISPYYIDLDALVEEGLLDSGDPGRVFWGDDTGKTNYAALYAGRDGILRKAFARWREKRGAEGAAYRDFREKSPWLDDYALFVAIKGREGGKSWLEWDAPLRTREGAALERARRELADGMEYTAFVQYVAQEQWAAVRACAAGAGIGIIGDMPIYVALDSADTWANPDLFQLDADRRPLRVAGCPPDPFAEDGQLWGNPLYDWEALAKTGYAWWISRLRAAFGLYDVVRIDHFRGLESYFSIDAGAKDARDGCWVKGPGMDFVRAISASATGASGPAGSGLSIIAEDLGFLTPEVRELLAESGFPGMKVLQFAFDTREPGASEYMPWNHPENSVVYTGTHDNDTSTGWFSTARAEDTETALAWFGLESPDARAGCAAFVRAALASTSRLAVIPMQDWLGLGSEARMNTPATLGGGNWEWRMNPGAATPELAARIRRLTEIARRHVE